MKMAKFSMSDLLNSQSKPKAPEAEEETKQWKVTNIPIGRIVPSPENKYGIRDIEDLAANIEMMGLLHNLVVRNGTVPGTYEIISGERRYEALKLLVSQGKTQYNLVPCKVEKSENQAINELQLLFANSMARELTDYEKTYQAGRIKELLKELKKSGYEFKGRMRDIVADMLKVSPAQMGRMESINKNLEPEFKEEFKAGNISITAAYELSRLPSTQQMQEITGYKQTGSVEIKDVQGKRDKAVHPAPPIPAKVQPVQQTETPVIATATQPAQRSKNTGCKQSQNNPITNFENITRSPEALTEFLQAIWSGKIQFDNLFCTNDCADNDDFSCPHEAECIAKWLNQSKGAEN